MAREKKKLNISCTSSDCGSGLHCFKATAELVNQNRAGVCRACGVQLVDWERVHSRNSRDVANTFAMLKLEMVRHFFWHLPLTERAINHARRKGKKELRAHVRKHLTRAIGPAHPWHDGTQTSMSENLSTAVPYAQHATATCCRKCLEYWHGIRQGEDISEQDLDYLVELVCMYLEERIPNLTDAGETIAPIRRQNRR